MLNGASAAGSDRAVIAQTAGAMFETFDEPVVTDSQAVEGRSEGAGNGPRLLAAGEVAAPPPSSARTTRPEIPRAKPTGACSFPPPTHGPAVDVLEPSSGVQQACNRGRVGKCAGMPDFGSRKRPPLMTLGWCRGNPCSVEFARFRKLSG